MNNENEIYCWQELGEGGKTWQIREDEFGYSLWVWDNKEFRFIIRVHPAVVRFMKYHIPFSWKGSQNLLRKLNK